MNNVTFIRNLNNENNAFPEMWDEVPAQLRDRTEGQFFVTETN